MSETGHDLALDDVALHDFRHVGFVGDPVPHAFRIDHDAGSQSQWSRQPALFARTNPFRFSRFVSLLKWAWSVSDPRLAQQPRGSSWAAGWCRRKYDVGMAARIILC